MTRVGVHKWAWPKKSWRLRPDSGLSARWQQLLLLIRILWFALETQLETIMTWNYCVRESDTYYTIYNYMIYSLNLPIYIAYLLSICDLLSIYKHTHCPLSGSSATRFTVCLQFPFTHTRTQQQQLSSHFYRFDFSHCFPLLLSFNIFVSALGSIAAAVAACPCFFSPFILFLLFYSLLLLFSCVCMCV